MLIEIENAKLADRPQFDLAVKFGYFKNNKSKKSFQS